MSNNKAQIILDVKAEIGQVKQAAQEMRGVFDKMDLSESVKRSFTSTFQKLSKEIRDFEVLSGKSMSTLGDTSKAQRKIEKITDLFEELKIQINDTQKLKLTSIVSSETTQKLKSYQNALAKVQDLQKKSNSASIISAQEKVTKAITARDNAEKALAQHTKKKAENTSELQRVTAEYEKQSKAADDLAASKKALGAIKEKTPEEAQKFNKLSRELKDLNDLTEKLSKEKNRLQVIQDRLNSSTDKYTDGVTEAKQELDKLNTALEEEKIKSGASEKEIAKLADQIAKLSGKKIDEIPKDLKGMEQELRKLGIDEKILDEIIADFSQMEKNIRGVSGASAQMEGKIKGAGDRIQQFSQVNSEIDQLKTNFSQFFTMLNGFNLFKRAIKDAYNSVKELDAAITEMAVVTEYSVNDIWGNMPQYTQTATELGATTKDVINSMVLYTQQGLEMAQATELSTETLKMARIAGLEGAEATDLMTAALRGFNMELNNTSAQRVNDVYSNLAANAAANTQEIADAMTRTASIANAAGMEFETTAAFLTQMIETTRESAENLGTAMKTIVARFTEMKKSPNEIVNVEGEEVSANKVEEALKSVGVQLRDTNGEFRNLDDVFLELSSKWDSLDKMSQRYVATTAAGSRQQSRFIAMMSNYQRTMELVGYATNSAGASQKQFEKTLDSLESKLNRLHDAWEQFTTGLSNQTIIKGIVDSLTNLLTLVNNVTDALDPFHTGWSKILAAFLGFKAAKKGVDAVFQNIGTQLGTRKAPESVDEDGTISKKPTTKEKWEQRKTSIKERLFGNAEEKYEAENTAKASNAAAAEAENKATAARQEAIKALKKKEEAEKRAGEAAQKHAEASKRATAAMEKEQKAAKKLNNLQKPLIDAEDDRAAALRKASASQDNKDIDEWISKEEALEKVQAEHKGKTDEITEAQKELSDALSEGDEAIKERQSTFSDLVKENNAAVDARKAYSTAELEANQAEATSEELNAQAKRDNAAAEEFKNKQVKVGLLSRVKAIAMATFQTEQDKLETLAKYGLISAEEKEAIAKGEMTLAQVSFNTALLTCPITWIIAGLAALAAIVAIVIINMDTTEKKFGRLKEATQQLGNQLNETQESINDLKSSWDSLKTLKSELSELTAGTVEWKQKLMEINQQTLDLLDKFPQLAQYMSSSNGMIEINSVGYDKVLNEYLENQKNQLASYNFSQAMTYSTSAQLMTEQGTSSNAKAKKENTNQPYVLKEEVKAEEEKGLSFFGAGLDSIAQNYIEKEEKIGNKINEQEKILISTLAANKKSLKYFEEIKDETKADSAEYARLTGLTKEQVEKKKEEGELNDEAIKILIASNKYQKEYTEKLPEMLNFTKTLSKDSTAYRSILGTNTLTESDMYHSGTTSARKIFADFIEDGEVKIEKGDEESAKQIIQDNFNIDANTLTRMEEFGGSIESIIENFLNTETSLKQYHDTLYQLGEDSKYLLPTVKAFEEGLDIKELSGDFKKQIAGVFKDIQSQGGNLDKFSSQINSIIKQFKNQDDVETFLTSLKDVDFSSETQVRAFSDNLADFGVIIDDKVKKQLVEATNAAKDFSMEQVVKELRNFELAEKISEKEEKNDRTISKKDYEDFAKELKKKGYNDFLEKWFVPRGDHYEFSGDFKELKDILLSTEEINTASNKLATSLNEGVKNTQNYKKAVEKLGYSPQKAEMGDNVYDLADKDKLEDLGIKEEAIQKLDFVNAFVRQTGVDKNGKQKTFTDPDTYADSLIYKLDTEGKALKREDATTLELASGADVQTDKVYDRQKIQSLYEAIKEDEKLLTLLPKQAIQDIYKAKIMGHKILEGESEEDVKKTLRLGDVQDGFVQTWANSSVEQNEKFLKEFQSIYGKITDDQVEEYKTKTAEEIEQFIKNLTPIDLTAEQEYLEQVDETNYQGLDNAIDIVNTVAKTTKGYKAQQKALHALNKEHIDYEYRLKLVQKATGLAGDDAERYLAIQYQLMDTYTEIVDILRDQDVKNMLEKGDDVLSASKGTRAYTEMLSKLANKFKKIFGDAIDEEWVERNLDLIRKLSKGGTEAKQAFEQLKNTEGVDLTTSRVTTPGDANGKQDEVFAKKLTSFEESMTDTNLLEGKTEEIKEYFNIIKKGLKDLDGSEASIEIKQNGRAAAMQAIKDAANVVLSKLLQTDKPEEINDLTSRLQLIKQLAADAGFSLTIPEIQRGGYVYEDDGTNTGPSTKMVTDAHGITRTVDRKMVYRATRIIGELDVSDTEGSSGPDVDFDPDGDQEGTDKTSKDHFWANDYDKQYNLLKKIEALERKRVELERTYNKLLKKRYLTEEELKNNKKQQVEFLNQQADINRQLRDQSLSYLRGMGNGDIWFDENLGTLVTNPNVANYNEDQMKVFNDTKSKMESFYSNWQSASSNLDTIYDNLEELTEKAEFTIDDIVANVTRASTIIEHTLANLDREIERLKRYDSGATTADFQKRYEQAMQTLVDKYNNKTEEIALQEQNINKMIYGEMKDYIEYDWDSRDYKRTAKYYGMTDPDFKDRIDKDIAEFDTAIDRLNELDNEREETRDTYYDKLHEVLDSRLEFEERVYNAVVQGREKEIEALENIDNSISSAASDLISSVQKNLQKMRQDRQNAKTEEELQNMEARLAYLQVDTSNANQKSVLDLQKQLTDKQQSYTDSLIDQKISELQQQNDEAAQQRKRQIEIMKTQLELDKQNGVIWKNVNDAILHGVDTSGRIQKDSELYSLLSSLDEVSKKSATQLERWYGELSSLAAIYRVNTGNFVSDKQMKDWLDNPDSLIGENGPYITALKSALEAMNRDGEYDGLIWYDQEGQQVRTRYDNYIAKDQHDLERYRAVLAEYQALAQELANLRAFYSRNENSRFTASFARQYDSGGLADYTGPAWLDGTPSSPELVLNQRDTKNFIQLKDILSNVMKGKSSKNDTNGDFYFEIHIDVDKVTSDYDVDQIANRIKQQITNEARYRNVNTINMIR